MLAEPVREQVEEVLLVSDVEPSTGGVVGVGLAMVWVMRIVAKEVGTTSPMRPSSVDAMEGHRDPGDEQFLPSGSMAVSSRLS